MKARYVLLASLYASQLLPLGFFYIALTAVLRREGASLERIGLIHLLALLWVLKSLWAPVIDRYGWPRLGHYRGWLILLQGSMVLGILGLIPMDVVSQPIPLFALVAAIAFLSATQDVAVDALAVRLLQVSERGPANGIQIAAGNLGFVLGGGGLLLVFDHLGWRPAVATLTVLTAAPLLLVIRYLSPEETNRSEAERSAVSLTRIVGFFRQSGVGRWMWAVVPFFYLGVAIPHKMITPMLVDAGWSLGRIGTVAAMGGGVIAMLAALGGGVLLSRRRRRVALLIIGVVQIAAIGAAVPLAAGVRHPIAGLTAIILLNVGYAATGAAVFTVNMDWSRPAFAAADYALLSSWAIIWSDVLGAAGLSVAGVIGYGWVTAVAVALSLIGLTAVAGIFRTQPGLEPAPATP
jgi:predicted MFS family arabinose efflux permease